MKKMMIGILIGFAMSIAATAYAETAKQFILTKVTYPIFVNGVEYKDEKLPALNYEGNTYIPLAKIGDILGVDYRWNAEKRRVEIGEPVKDDQPAANSAANKAVSYDGYELYVTDGTGKYAGYKMLHGYPGQDKYQIYFQGDERSYHTTIEDLRGINLNERITWRYGGRTYTNTRSELYSFFADTTWFRNNLKDITDYTLTEEWFLDVFGDVFLDWAEGIGYSTEAASWVEKYFRQTAERDPNMPFVTLTPDAAVVTVGNNQPEEPSVDDIIRDIENLYRKDQLLTEEEKKFHADWISRKELEEEYGIRAVEYIDPDGVQLWLRRYNEQTRRNETIYKIYNFQMKGYVEWGQILSGSGIRYQYYEGNPDLLNGGLYFNRQDLKNAGIIP